MLLEHNRICREYKWTGTYIAPFYLNTQKALYNMPHSQVLSMWRTTGLFFVCEDISLQYLAHGYFGMQTGAAREPNRQASN